MATIVLSVCASNNQATGQSGDVVRIRTRVVFVDVLIKDKRTNTPVTDLKIDNFEIFDNGRLRQPTYFSGQGEKTERPLALVVLLAPMDDRARNSMQDPAILKSMATALAKLPPEDELAVMFSWWEELFHRKLWSLSPMTVRRFLRLWLTCQASPGPSHLTHQVAHFNLSKRLWLQLLPNDHALKWRLL